MPLSFIFISNSLEGMCLFLSFLSSSIHSQLTLTRLFFPWINLSNKNGTNKTYKDDDDNTIAKTSNPKMSRAKQHIKINKQTKQNYKIALKPSHGSNATQYYIKNERNDRKFQSAVKNERKQLCKYLHWKTTKPDVDIK